MYISIYTHRRILESRHLAGPLEASRSEACSGHACSRCRDAIIVILVVIVTVIVILTIVIILAVPLICVYIYIYICRIIY